MAERYRLVSGVAKFCSRRCATAYGREVYAADVDDRLLRRLDKYSIYRGDDQCWAWTGFKHRGYGRLHIGKKSEGAHRISYRLRVGPIPEGMTVLHRCDNPECTNPRHLFLGTNTDNNLDRDRKGRAAKGERSGRAKLTETLVRRLRATQPAPAERRRIASEIGARERALKLAMDGKTWKHVA